MPQALTTEAPRPVALPEPLYVQLPARGQRKALGHDAVASNQRSRLMGAMIEEVAERGYANATVARLVALARPTARRMIGGRGYVRPFTHMPRRSWKSPRRRGLCSWRCSARDRPR